MNKTDRNLLRALERRATEDTAEFVEANMKGLKVIAGENERLKMIDYLFANYPPDPGGLILEFGVAKGQSLRRICAAAGPKRKVYGFDSFDGLPSDWTWGKEEGRFDMNGKAPDGLPSNAMLKIGLIEDTLPEFLRLEPSYSSAGFIHVDTDIYASASFILEYLADKIVPGTVILFDEFFNYAGWRDHEYRAFREFVGRHKRKFEYLAFTSTHGSVAVRITK